MGFGVGWPSAVAVLSKQVASGVQVDVLHSNAILSSFSDSLPARVASTWLVTVQLLQWMGCVAVRSDTRSYNIARNHVVQGHGAQGGQWEIANFLLEKQKHCALDMSMVSMGCSADACAKAARWMDAMLCLTTRPNVVSWRFIQALDLFENLRQDEETQRLAGFRKTPLICLMFTSSITRLPGLKNQHGIQAEEVCVILRFW